MLHSDRNGIEEKNEEKNDDKDIEGIETVTVQGAQCQEIHQRIAGGQMQNNDTKGVWTV